MAEIAGPDVGPEQQPFALADWLLREGRFVPGTGELLAGLCLRLVAAGLPLWWVTYHRRMLHPRIDPPETTTPCRPAALRSDGQLQSAPF